MDFYIKRRRKIGRPIIWIHPITGDYKIPASDEQELPLRYKMQGYEVREFTSFIEHDRWCKSKGLVNHYAEGIKDDAIGRPADKDSLGN